MVGTGGISFDPMYSRILKSRMAKTAKAILRISLEGSKVLHRVNPMSVSKVPRYSGPARRWCTVKPEECEKASTSDQNPFRQ